MARRYKLRIRGRMIGNVGPFSSSMHHELRFVVHTAGCVAPEKYWDRETGTDMTPRSVP